MPKPRRISLAILLLLMLLAAAVRGMALTDSLWLDELHTSWVVSDSPSEIGPRARLGNQQPLYFYLPWMSIGLFGEQEWALRLPSYLAGIGLIPAVYFLALRWTGSTLAALTVAALALLDRQWLFYAQEARVYAVLQLAAVGQFALIGRLLERPTHRLRLAHVVLAAIMFYLHYTTALLIVAGWVAGGVLRERSMVAAARDSGERGERRGERNVAGQGEYGWSQMAVDLGGYALLIAPALPHVAAVADRRENWERFVQQPTWYDWLYLFPLDVYLLAAMLLAGLLAAGHWLLSGKSAADAPASRPSANHVWLAACWLLVPICLAWLATATDLARLFFPRYLIGASAGALLIAGMCIASLRSKASRAMLAVMLIYLAAWRGGWLMADTYRESLTSHAGEQWREAIATIAQENASGAQAVLIDARLIESDEWFDSSDPLKRAYCELPLRGMYRLPAETHQPVAFSLRQMQAEGDQWGSASHVWLLIRSSQTMPEDFAVNDSAAESHRLRVLASRSFGGVQLLKLQVE